MIFFFIYIFFFQVINQSLSTLQKFPSIIYLITCPWKYQNNFISICCCIWVIYAIFIFVQQQNVTNKSITNENERERKRKKPTTNKIYTSLWRSLNNLKDNIFKCYPFDRTSPLLDFYVNSSQLFPCFGCCCCVYVCVLGCVFFSGSCDFICQIINYSF